MAETKRKSEKNLPPSAETFECAQANFLASAFSKKEAIPFIAKLGDELLFYYRGQSTLFQEIIWRYEGVLAEMRLRVGRQLGC